jgi:hypothetical protein
MTNTQQAFIQAQQSLANLHSLGKKAYNGRYQAAVQVERKAKATLIAEQNIKDSCQV